MIRRKTVGYTAILIGLAACAREPKSEIVEKVQAAGSGNLSKVSNAGMREWLGKHKDLAYQVNDMCKPARAKSTANWSDTTEGRLCNTARELAFFRSGPIKNSGQTYWPGK
jgi:flagellar basal body rod protein FlgF